MCEQCFHFQIFGITNYSVNLRQKFVKGLGPNCEVPILNPASSYCCYYCDLIPFILDCYWSIGSAQASLRANTLSMSWIINKRGHHKINTWYLDGYTSKYFNVICGLVKSSVYFFILDLHLLEWKDLFSLIVNNMCSLFSSCLDNKWTYFSSAKKEEWVSEVGSHPKLIRNVDSNYGLGTKKRHN